MVIVDEVVELVNEVDELVVEVVELVVVVGSPARCSPIESVTRNVMMPDTAITAQTT